MSTRRQRLATDFLRGAVARRRGALGGDDKLELIDEDEVVRHLATTPLARDDEERETAMRARVKAAHNEDLTPREAHLYEAIVVPTERPALFVDSGTITQPSAPWGELSSAATLPIVERAIRAVGRVELHGPTARPYAGTGFVVGPGLIMTNRHVAQLFARGEGLQARFVDGFGSGIDFSAERRSTSKKELPIARVVMFHPYWDAALLAVQGLGVAPLTLEPRDAAECQARKVIVVGYPAFDPYGDPDVQQRVFGGVYNVKRVQPGFALGAIEFADGGPTRRVLAHDSSTLGGNSGSAVVDLETGHVIGLHFAGDYLKANYAVPAFELARDGHVRDAGVRFAGGAAEEPNPFGRAWSNVPNALAVPPTPGPTPPGPDLSRSVPPERWTSDDIRVRIPIEVTIRIGKVS
jgi:S1-C subfamily serine protease